MMGPGWDGCVCVCVWTRLCSVIVFCIAPLIYADFATSRGLSGGGRRWTEGGDGLAILGYGIGGRGGGGARFCEKEWEFIELCEESASRSIMML
jgi:hypothetical protein